MSGTDMVIAQKLHDLTNTASRIQGAVTSLENEAVKAEEVLSRVEVDDEDSLGRAMELIRSMKNVAKEGDLTRKGFTTPINDVSSLIKTVFDAPINRILKVSEKISTKTNAYIAEVNARLRKLAEDERRQAEERALAVAQQAEKDGDSAGADKILAVASDVIAGLDVATVKSKTVFGSTVYTRVSVNVEIANQAAFLAWAVSTLPPEELNAIDVPKSLLNRIVKSRVDTDNHKILQHVPGLTITFKDTGGMI